MIQEVDGRILKTFKQGPAIVLNVSKTELSTFKNARVFDHQRGKVKISGQCKNVHNTNGLGCHIKKSTSSGNDSSQIVTGIKLHLH